MLIPEHKVDEIRLKADIVEVISENIDLKRVGSNFVGFSPFKDEKTPSFVVSPDKQIYKDFSSGKAGNAFTFLMDYHGMSFIESCKTLAAKYGIELGDVQEQDSEAVSKSQAHNAAEFAAGQYYNLLLSKEGKNTYNYFVGRGFSRDLIDKFKLGYAPESWDFILKSAKKAGFTEQNLIDAGLIIDKEETNKIFDRFRNRAIFTIRDYIGRTLGFGGRILSDDKKQAKYINSPQSLIYDKSNVLYGIFEAKNAIRNKKEAILVEGYADVLALVSEGFENVVAASGTALTSGQLKLLKRYANKIFFMLDADSAGIAATEKGLILALEHNFEVRVVNLTAGEDPDTMLKKSGKKSVEYALRDALDFIDYKIKRFKETDRMSSPQGLSSGVRELIGIVRKIPDKLQHDFYISRIASSFSLTENQLRQVYKEQMPQKRTSVKQQETAIQEEKDIRKAIVEDILPEELIIIKFIINDEENLHILFENFELFVDMFLSKSGKRLFNMLLKYSDKKNILDAIITDKSADSEFLDFITEIAINEEKPSENWKRFMRELELEGFEVSINDAIRSLKMRQIEKQLNLLKEKIKKNPQEISYMQEIKKLTEERVCLYNIINQNM